MGMMGSMGMMGVMGILQLIPLFPLFSFFSLAIPMRSTNRRWSQVQGNALINECKMIVGSQTFFL
jgi:hypothetical protein